MKRKVIILLTLHFCFCVFIKSQDSIKLKPQHLFGVGSGLSQNIIRNEIISPFIYSGTKLPFEISYRRLGEKSRHSFLIYYSNMKLKPSVPKSLRDRDYSMRNINFLFQYTYNKKVYTLPGNNLHFYIGGKLKSFLNYTDHIFGTSYKSENAFPTIDQVNGLDLNIMIEKRFTSSKDRILYLNINTPIVAYVLLNNMYNSNVGESVKKIDVVGKDKNDMIRQVIKSGEIVSISKLRGFQTELAYTTFTGSHVGFEFKYRLNFYRLEKYDKLFYSKYLSNQLLIGLIIKI